MRRLAVLIALLFAAPAQAHEWRTLDTSRLKRTEVSAGRIGGAIYVAGGYDRRSHSTDAVERYDIAKDRWTSLPPMPTARGALTAAVIGDRLYAAGGAVDGQALTTLEVYDFTTRRWSPGPPMRAAREHLGGTAASGAFYVLAGRAPGNFTVAERYVPARNAWEQLPDLEHPRGGTAAALSDGRIVIAGGEESAGTIAAVELFDPRTRRWSALADMPRPRHGLGVVARGQTIYTVQGGVKPGFSFSGAIESLRVPRR